ncbi:hypothetical protein F53441_11937 [Fusarium austroafricanum]|uniref:Uncharacterized protein n=1 Tax=Fusarium austroafricanum TaxID=2364996 RepID=A0A8H4NXU3_9HYPO|nr:hypothetical protein F53441_11937 [Fusarium austroafricanum]
MSIPSAALVFESGINAIPSNPMEPNSLDALVRRQLEAVSRELASKTKFTTTDPLSERQNIIHDVGEYLAQTAQMWLSLTDRLVQGPHVTLAAEEAHEQSYNKTHMADLRPMATMDMNISKLGKIRDLAEKFSEDVQEIWRRTPEPGGVLSAPTYQTASSLPTIKSEPVSWNRSFSSGTDADAGTRDGQRALASRSTDGAPSPTGNGSMSEDSGDDEDEQFSKIDMDALKQRGKGSYYCPLGHRCDKGGVDKEGKLVLFDRNSSFA